MDVVQQQIPQSSQLGTAVCGVHAEENNTVGRQLQTHDQFAEVFVFGHENPLLVGRHLQHGLVICPRRNLLHVEQVMAVAAQAFHEQRITTFVGEKIHRAAPEATTISSLARWSAAKAAAALISFTAR